MAFNGAGVFLRLYNWVNDKAGGIKITASRMDAEFNGIAAGLTNCITRDGQTTPTANIPLGGNKLTGLGTPTLSTDAATKAYADLMLPLAGGTVTGTVLFNNPLRGALYGTILNPGTLTLGTIQSGLVYIYGFTGAGGLEFSDVVNCIVGTKSPINQINNGGCASRVYGQDGSGFLTVSLSGGAALTYSIYVTTIRS